MTLLCKACGQPDYDHRDGCTLDQPTTTRGTMDQIIEAVSAKVHENWMASKRAAGVESRKLESGEELMVPYDQLTDAAKELDRGTVRTVLAVLPDLGFAVVGK